MQRGLSSFADTRRITFSNTIGEDQRIKLFSRLCVGGDGHPVGVRRHLNDPRIYEPPRWRFF